MASTTSVDTCARAPSDAPSAECAPLWAAASTPSTASVARSVSRVGGGASLTPRALSVWPGGSSHPYVISRSAAVCRAGNRRQLRASFSARWLRAESAHAKWVASLRRLGFTDARVLEFSQFASAGARAARAAAGAKRWSDADAANVACFRRLYFAGRLERIASAATLRGLAFFAVLASEGNSAGSAHAAVAALFNNPGALDAHIAAGAATVGLRAALARCQGNDDLRAFISRALPPALHDDAASFCGFFAPRKVGAPPPPAAAANKNNNNNNKKKSAGKKQQPMPTDVQAHAAMALNFFTVAGADFIPLCSRTWKREELCL